MRETSSIKIKSLIINILPKAGKSTLASQYPSPLFLATERGYNALSGVYAVDITSWAELRQILRELKKPGVKTKFKTIVVDTVDRAATMCEKYICDQKDVNSLSEVPYGGGWSALKKEFEDVFNTIAQNGYAIVFISHSKEGTFKRQDQTEYTLIYPSVSSSYNSIIENMVDLYGYLHPVFSDGKSKVVLTLRSLDGTVRAGGRFKYIAPEIDASYDALVKALNDAIDEEARVHGDEYITDKKNELTVATELNFDELMNSFNDTIEFLLNNYSNDEFDTYWQPRITHIVEKYLGKGKKVKQCTRDQVEMLVLIVDELQEEVQQSNKDKNK